MSRNEYRILSARFGRKDGHRLPVYESEGGYKALRMVLGSMSAAEVRDVVKDSGLRGRGGAGFPTGVKWGFVPEAAEDVYFFVNADESEPGTFKDRYLLDYDPHQTIEGTIISCFAVRAKLAFIYIRGEFGWLIDRVNKAVEEAYAAGYLLYSRLIATTVLSLRPDAVWLLSDGNFKPRAAEAIRGLGEELSAIRAGDGIKCHTGASAPVNQPPITSSGSAAST